MKALLTILVFLAMTPLAQAQTLVAVSPEADQGIMRNQLHSALEGQGLSSKKLNVLSKRLGIYEFKETLTEKQMARLRNQKIITHVAKDFSLSLLKPPRVDDVGVSKKEYRGVWGIDNQGLEDQDKLTGVPGVDISALKAWEMEKGSSDVVVGIVDSGIDIDHPKLKSSLWVNRAEANGKEGVDDDGNGYVDDVHGYDFVNDKPNGVDDVGHGTHVAGTVAAAKGKYGHQGMAPNARVMALKCFNSEGRALVSSFVKAVDYGLEKGVRFYNHSWAIFRKKDFIREIFKRMDKLDVLNVVAAGNSGMSLENRTYVPSSLPFDSILSVAAVDHAGNMAWYSSWSPKSVDLSAPGHRVLSTYKSGGYKQLSGTSMASPHVAGVAALLASYDPDMKASDIKKRLMRTVKPLPSMKNVTKSEGMVSAFHALSDLTAQSPIGDFSNWNRKEFHLESKHPYWNDRDEEFEIKVPGAEKMVVFFERFELHESDNVKFHGPGGGWWSKPRLFGVWKNHFHNRYSPIVEGDTMVIDLHASFSHNAYGFRISHILWK